MRQYVLVALLLLPLWCWGQQVQQQRYSKSVFLLESFAQGQVQRPFAGYVSDTLRMNFFLKDASLCFIRDERIYKADVRNILSVRIGGEEYHNVNGQMGHVLAHRGVNYLLCVTTVDMNAFTADRYSHAHAGFFDVNVDVAVGPTQNLILDLGRQMREDEQGYPLRDTFYFQVGGKVVRANQTQFKRLVPAEKRKAFREKMKDRLWSWSDPASLMQLMDFLPD